MFDEHKDMCGTSPALVCVCYQLASMVTDLLRKAEVPQLVQSTGLQQRHHVAYTDSEFEDDFS